MSGKQCKLRPSMLAFLTILSSFVAGVAASMGVDILEKQSGFDWMAPFGLSFFFLVSAINDARQLLRRTTDPEVS